MTGGDRLHPNRDRKAPPVTRRRLLAGSATVGAATVAGCPGDGGDATGPDATPTAELTEAPTVLVFNTGDRTVTLVDADRDEVVATTPVGVTVSFPSNQYTPKIIDSAADSFWVNVDQGVRALRADDLTERARVETGTGRNWQELTPDGNSLLVSAREPAHTLYLIDADPDSETFGEIEWERDRTDEGGRGDDEGPGPCDVTIHPDERYAYVPDLYGDALTVVDVESPAIERQVAVDPGDRDAATPWMGTVGPNGERLLVEHRNGIETVWDVSDPADPTEIARLTEEEGLGDGPLTSEISADGSTGFVFTPDSGDVTVVDLEDGTVAGRIDLGGRGPTGTWDPDRETLYIPVQDANEVAVIDPGAREVTARLDTGVSPYGATAARVRPNPTPAPTESALGALGLLDSGTSYCIGHCACGHDPDAM